MGLLPTYLYVVRYSWCDEDWHIQHMKYTIYYKDENILQMIPANYHYVFLLKWAIRYKTTCIKI